MNYYDRQEESEQKQLASLVGSQEAITFRKGPPTQREQLTNRKQALTADLQRVNEALDILDKHPEIEKFHDVLQRGLY